NRSADHEVAKRLTICSITRKLKASCRPGSGRVVHVRMDVIGSEADLMCSVKRRQVFGELFDHRVRHARRADVLSERAGNVQPYKTLPSCRVIEILHAQVAIVVEVLDQAL